MRRVFASTGSAPSYSYDPYGVPLQATAPLTDFGYAGMFADADSGLNLTKYRAYDPVAGRWLSRDPLGPAGNLYVYVDGNPVSIVDPMGLCGQSWQDFLQGIIGNPVLLATIVGTAIIGGGPEDPIADAAVVAEIEAAQAAESAAGGAAATGFRGSKGFELVQPGYQPIRNIPGEVNGQGYSSHAFDQMQNRGIMPSVVDNAVETGTIFPTKAGTTGYYDAANKVHVIVNSSTGKVITVIRGKP